MSDIGVECTVYCTAVMWCGAVWKVRCSVCPYHSLVKATHHNEAEGNGEPIDEAEAALRNVPQLRCE